MEKSYENIMIERPKLSKNSIEIIFKENTVLSLKDIFFSENSRDESFSLEKQLVRVNKNKIFIDLQNIEINPYIIYYLIGRTQDGLPVRFTYENICEELPYEGHTTICLSKSSGLKTDLFLNQWGNIGIQKIPAHILDSDICRFPINREISSLEVNEDEIKVDMDIQFDIHRMDLSKAKVYPVLIEVDNSVTSICILNDYNVQKNANRLTVECVIKNINCLNKITSYSFGLKINYANNDYILLVNQVAYSVFKKIHPYSKEKFVFKNSIVNFGWFDKEGIILTRNESEDIKFKEQLRFKGNYRFNEITSEDGIRELDELYVKFQKGWIYNSSYRSF